MNRKYFASYTLLLCGALSTTIATAGCSGGDDVYIEPATQKNQSSLKCDLTPGEDICTRDWSAIPNADRSKTLGILDLVVTFAGLARDNITILNDTCVTTLDELGVTRPTFPTSLGPSERATTTCELAVRAMRDALPTNPMFDVSIKPPVCTTAAPTAKCGEQTASSGTRVICAPAEATVTYREGASANDRRIGEVFRRTEAVLADRKASLEILAKLSSSISSSVSVLADAPPSCIPGATALTTGATSDVQVMVNLTANLGALVER